MKNFIFFILSLFPFLSISNEKPNIIWITVDTLRKDYVGKWSSKNLSPNIDNLLKDSIILDNCFTPTPITFPSYTSALTGTHPLKHGVFFNAGFSIPENLKTIAQILKENGYKTIAVVGGNPLHYGKGLERGFDIYDDEFLKRPETGNPLFKLKRYEEALNEMALRPAEDITALGISYIKEAKKPYFLFLHYYDPHTPYSPPEKFGKKNLNNLYAGEVEYTDYSIGILINELKKLNEYDKNIIVFFSDHGEGLGEHNEDEHGYFLYNTTVEIPASIKLPHSKIKKEIKELTSILDITPTILDLIGIKFKCDGISLKNAIYGNEKIKGRDFILMTKMGKLYFGFEEIDGIISLPYKAIFSSEPEVFDILKDKKEEKNLYPENFKELKKIYINLLKNFKGLKEKDSKFKTEEMEKLKSLGYITPAKNLPEKKIPPSKWNEVINIYKKGNESHFLGKYEEAIKIYSEYLKKDPENFRILNERGILYTQIEKYSEAKMDFLKAKEIIFNSYEVYENLLNLYFKSKNFNELKNLLKEAEKIYKNDLKFSNYKIELLKEEKKYSEALSLLDSLLKEYDEDWLYISKIDILILKNDINSLKNFLKENLNKKNKERPIFYFLEGMLSEMEGNSEKALFFYKKSIENGAQFYHPYYFAGLKEKENKNFKEAEKYLKVAYLLEKNSPKVLYELGDLLAISGRFEEAYFFFSKAAEIDKNSFSIRLSLLKISYILSKEKSFNENLEWIKKNYQKELEKLKDTDPLIKEILNNY